MLFSIGLGPAAKPTQKLVVDSSESRALPFRRPLLVLNLEGWRDDSQLRHPDARRRTGYRWHTRPHARRAPPRCLRSLAGSGGGAVAAAAADAAV